MEITVYPIRVQSGHFINYSYCILSINTKTALLIDPAWEPEKINGLLSQYPVENLHVLLTHSHYDHTDLAEYYHREKQALIWISQEEKGNLSFRTQNLQCIRSESRLPIQDVEVYPIFTPGHTPGSICYYMKPYLFTGDTLFSEGCGMCFDNHSSPLNLYHSLQKLKNLTPPNTLIYPGHSFGRQPGETFETVTNNNIYLQFFSPDDFINFRMRPNQAGWLSFK